MDEWRGEVEVTMDERIACPWCGYVDEDTWDDFQTPSSLEGSRDDYQCVSCNRSFALQWTRVVTFQATRSGGGGE